MTVMQIVTGAKSENGAKREVDTGMSVTGQLIGSSRAAYARRTTR